MNYKQILLALTITFVVINADAQSLMYIPNGDGNQVLVIDLKNDQIINRFEELENAHGLAGHNKSPYLLAGSMLTQSATSKGAAKPKNMSQDEHTAHHKADKKTSGGSFLSVVHIQHGHVMQRIPVKGFSHHIAFSPDGKTAVAVHSGAGSISILDVANKRVKQYVKTGLVPNYAVYNKQGSRLYVSNSGDGIISEFETKTWGLKRKIRVGKYPEHFVFHDQKQKLFVANVGDASVSIVDLKAGKVTKTYNVGKQPHGIDISEDGKWLFVAAQGDNKISRIRLDDGKVDTLKLSPAPYHVAYLAKERKIYISSRQKPLIWVLDPKTLKIKKRLDIGKGVAHQMVILNKSK